MTQVRTMYTPPNDDGTHSVHSPDYHAEITAEKIIGELETSIISIAPTAANETIVAGRDLRKKIEAILTSHHQSVHDHEQAQLKQHGLDRLKQGARFEIPSDDGTTKSDLVIADSKEVLTDDGAQSILGEIQNAAKASPFAALFVRDDVKTAIISELHHESRSQMMVHRSVHRHNDALANKPKLVQ